MLPRGWEVATSLKLFPGDPSKFLEKSSTQYSCIGEPEIPTLAVGLFEVIDISSVMSPTSTSLQKTHCTVMCQLVRLRVNLLGSCGRHRRHWCNIDWYGISDISGMTWHIDPNTLISVYYVNQHFLLVLEIGLLDWMTNPYSTLLWISGYKQVSLLVVGTLPTYCVGHNLHKQIHLTKAGSNTNNLHFEHVLLQPEVRCFFPFCFRQFCCHNYLGKVTIFHKKYPCILWSPTSL